ncbi:MAG TPA: BTAD domain-containing putative transcriptional regulator [Acidimicrobiales bacterium]
MRVRVLGGFSVDGIAERDLGSRKARALLKVLALARGAPVSVERLVDVLWGEHPPARPADQVGVLVSRLRGVLGADRIARTDAGFALRTDWLDVDELAARVREAADALRADRLGAARAAAHAATALARGTVLPEEDGDWVEVERAAANALAGSARRIAAEAAAQAGDHHAAVAAAEEALAHDPYDEAALQVLMRAHVASGRPASALAAYVRVRDRLGDDLGVSPTAATEALHDEIVLADPPAPNPSEAPASLPGRAAELAALDAALERAVASPVPVTVAIVGEAGIGKTSLVEHWCARMHGNVLTLVGRCDSLGRDLPLQPISEAVAAHLSRLPYGERLSMLGSEAPALGPLLGVDAGTGSAIAGASAGATVVNDPDIGRARLFTALLTLVARLAEERVAVVVVDDLHLAGESTRAWLAFARRRPHRMLLVTTSRDTTSDADEVIALGPLGLDATATIVGAERATELHARSGGHPLLLAALADAGDAATPATVHDAVVRRIASLGGASTTLMSAAVLGSEVDLDLLADVLRVPAVALLEHLEAAVASGVLVERGAGFAFRHELEREALDASAGAARRALVHRDAARVLASAASPDPLAVAVHARLGGELDLAIEWFTRAAGIALARYDIAAATELVEAALALGDDPVAFAMRARLRMATSRLDDAAEDARRAVANGGGAAALEVAGWAAYYQRRYDEALAFADAASERATEPSVRISSLALAGRVRHAAGALVEAVADLERATTMEGPADARELAAVWLAHTRVHQGRPTAALRLLDRALVDPGRLPHPFAPLHGLFARALALGQLGRVDEALRACDDLDALVVQSGEAGQRMRGRAANTRAWILRWTGRTDEADALNQDGLAAYDPMGPRGEAYYAGMLDLADGRLLAGDDAAAADLVGRIATIDTWHGTMAWHQKHRWKLVRARLALRDGDATTAEALSADVAADAASRSARRYELFALALGALAGSATARDPSRLEAVVAGLEDCAALDGRQLVEQLTRLRPG